jgi:hypothetical protein
MRFDDRLGGSEGLDDRHGIGDCVKRTMPLGRGVFDLRSDLDGRGPVPMVGLPRTVVVGGGPKPFMAFLARRILRGAPPCASYDLGLMVEGSTACPPFLKRRGPRWVAGRS